MIEAVRERNEAHLDELTALAWMTANFTRAKKKLKPLAHYMRRKAPPAPVTDEERNALVQAGQRMRDVLERRWSRRGER